MKIACIGSHAYREMMERYQQNMWANGHTVKIPAFDSHPELDELGICTYNKDIIEWADEVHIFWDLRSQGTIFDFGMTFALGKKIKIAYLEPKTFVNLMRQYEKRS